MRIENNRFNLRYLKSAGDFIVLKVRVHHPAGLRVHEAFFEQRLPEPHDNAAVNLAFCRQPVDGQPAILHGDNFQHLDDSRLRIHFNFSELRACHTALAEFFVPLSAFADSLHAKLPCRLCPGERLRPVGDDINSACADAQFFRRCL